MKKFLGLVFIVIACIALIGCGGGGSGGTEKSGNASLSRVEYGPIKSAGYYLDLRMQPNGEFLVGPIVDEATAKKNGVVYKVDLNENKKLEKITAMYNGNPINTEWRDTINNKYTFSAITIEYQDGYDKYNFKDARMGATKGFYGAYSIRYKIDDKKKNHKIAYLYNKQAEQASVALGFAQFLFTYDDKDHLTKVGYANTNGERVTTTTKNYETRFKYDSKSVLPIEVANYGKDESLMVDSSSIAKTTYKYDEKGRLVEVRHFGADESLKERNSSNLQIEDKMMNFISAGAITRYTYDAESIQPKKVAFFGKDEQPIGIKSWNNIASFQFGYTPQGLISSISSFGTDDTPHALDKEDLGDNVVKIAYDYDDFGNLTGIKFFGKEDNMVVASKELSLN
ncbi:MAG: hypothetical protein IJS96_00385 [Schwartzia sp.]|nr:hypothetical protein [Schwartzia sp. (in: firmicutes)]